MSRYYIVGLWCQPDNWATEYTDPRVDFVGYMREELMMLGMDQVILDEWLARHPSLSSQEMLNAYLEEFPDHKDIFPTA